MVSAAAPDAAVAGARAFWVPAECTPDAWQCQLGKGRARQGQGQDRPWRGPDPPIWTGQRESQTLRSPGNAGRGLRGSRRPPQPSDFGSVARTGPASPRPGSPVASGPLSPPDLREPEPGRRGGRFFFSPSWERRGPAPSHHPDVSGHRSEDLPEARSRRVQREKPTLGSFGGAPTSSWGSAPGAAWRKGRCSHPR